MAAPTPWLLWIFLTVAGIAVGGAILAVAFAVYNRGEKRRLQGFEVKPATPGGEPGVLREKEIDHG